MGLGMVARPRLADFSRGRKAYSQQLVGPGLREKLAH